MVFALQKTVPLQSLTRINEEEVEEDGPGPVFEDWAYGLSWFSFGESSRKLILPHLFFKNRSPS